MTAAAILSPIWQQLGFDPAALNRLTLAGDDAILPSFYDVSGLAQASIGGVALAASEVWRQAHGEDRSVTVDRAHAAIEFRSERYCRINGEKPANLWDPLAAAYRCADQRWLRVHTNFAHHRRALIDLLNCSAERAAVTAAFAGRSAAEIETAAAAHGAITAMMRTTDEWRGSAQGQAIAALPLVAIDKIADSPPVPIKADKRPLDGLRVLDLTRIIAGPVCGRVLAAHGADVMAITAPHLPAVLPLVMDGGRGKRSGYLDLRTSADQARLSGLLNDADIFVQGYRPGAIAGQGFGAADVAAKHPGIIYVSLSAYGHQGPWSGRRGFDSIAQAAIGINHGEAAGFGVTDQPQALPAQALDHGSGYLLALGALAAVLRRAEEGGSWHVQVALARTGHWLQDIPPAVNGIAAAEPDDDRVNALLEAHESGFGPMRAIKHAGMIDGLPPHWSRPSVPLGRHAAAW